MPRKKDQEDLFARQESQKLMALIVEVGLHGLAPRNYDKHIVHAKRLLSKAPLSHWTEAVHAMRAFVFPYSEGDPFDLYDLEKKDHIALAAKKKKRNEEQATPIWLRRGFANDEQPEEPRMGDRWTIPPNS